MCFLTRPSWDAPDPNTSPPALHDARYDGWPNPPIQLPWVASSSPASKKRAERHFAFSVDTPSNCRPQDSNATHTHHHSLHLQCDTHPRAKSGAQDVFEYRSHDVSNSCMWNGGTHQKSPLQGAFETRIAARYDKENAAIKHDSARRTKNSNPLINKDIEIAYLLAAPRMPLVYDLRYPPDSLYFAPSSPYAGRGSEFLQVPLTPTRPKQVRLISRDFPWAIDISPEPGAKEQVVTCLGVLSALHAALQRPLSDTEWGIATEDKHASLIRARDRRLNMKSALRGSPNSRARTTTKPKVRFALDGDARPVQREPLILRVDWLGSRVAFGGLFKDDAFAKRRVIPGAREPSETWVVKFQSLS